MVKRKLCHDLRDASAQNQLHSVLDISLDKFQRDQALADPSLRRSVLIANTLRRTKTHMEAFSENGTAHKETQPGPLMPPWWDPAAFEDVGADSAGEFSLSGTVSAILRDLDAEKDGGCASSALQRAPLGLLENGRRVKGSTNIQTSAAIDGLLLDIKASVRAAEPTEQAFRYLPYVCTT